MGVDLTKATDEQDHLSHEPADSCGEEGFVRNNSDKVSHSRFPLVCAFSCAWHGFMYAMRTQRNMKIHGVIALIAIILGFVFSLDGASWAAIILCIACVFAAECLNTALESVVDLVSPTYHDLARHAKDCAAAAVLICSVAAVAVAAVIFIPRMLAFVGVWV